MSIAIAPTIPGSQNLKSLNVQSILISGDNTSNTGLEIINNHIKVGQTVPQTVSTGTVVNASDVVGVITFTSTGLAGVQTVLTFDSVYESAPVIQLTPRNINAGVNTIGYFSVSQTVSVFSSGNNSKFNFSKPCFTLSIVS